MADSTPFNLSRVSSKTLFHVLQSSDIGLWFWDIDKNLNNINDAWAEMLGYTRDELQPMTFEDFRDLVHPEDFPALQKTLQGQLADQGEALRNTFRLKHKKGDYRWVKARGEVIERKDGKPLLMGGIHIDVSDLMGRVELETILARKLDLVLTSSPAVVYELEVEPPFKPLYISPNIEAVFQVRKEIFAKPNGWHSVVHPEDISLAHDKFSDWLSDKSKVDLTRRYRTKTNTGNYIWLEDRVSKIFQDGQLKSVVGSVQNIDQKITETRLIEHIADVVPGVIYQFKRDKDGQYSFPYSSKKLKDVYGVNPEAVKFSADEVLAAIHPDDFEHVAQSIEESAATGNEWQAEYRAVINGKSQWLQGHAMPEKQEDGSVLWFGMIMNIDRLKHAEIEADKARIRLERAQRIARIGHWEAYMTTGELYWSDVIYEIFGFDKSEIIPSVELFTQCVHPDDIEAVRESERRAKITGLHDVEHRIVRPDGEVRWVHVLANYSELSDHSGILTGTVQDITRAKQLELELRKQSTTDSLTQIANRRHFMTVAEQGVERCKRHSKPVSLISLDIDHFKLVNDTYGHAMGDVVLVTLARRVKEQLRSIDQFARIGGEEFAILLEQTSLESALEVAEKLRHTISDLTFAAGNQQFSVTASFGVTSCNSKDKTLSTLMNEADSALYRAKEEGRNRVIAASL
ncbi:MAG: sensory protein with GGDEF and PAS domains [Idiomarinaceae bacterium HL-53]|nr:MAG: sensory protein with GGDEF and PAS domains [Idiomarinaceae bacterium HL-53]CUS48069.1 PAS domain S-box-containing protein/diguanylate cyclase (GGDEF) domain-containing protein [Idiomarinaceae bacterium HL-53]